MVGARLPRSCATCWWPSMSPAAASRSSPPPTTLRLSCLSPAGDRIAFLAWDLPDMPWDSATLFVAPVHADGALGGCHPRCRRQRRGRLSAGMVRWQRTLEFHFGRERLGTALRLGWRQGAPPLWAARRRSVATAAGVRYAQLLPAPNGSIGAVALRQGRPLLEVWDPKRGRRTRYASLASKAARIDDPVAFAGGFAALISRPTAMPEVMRIGRREVKGFAGPPAQYPAAGAAVGLSQRRQPTLPFAPADAPCMASTMPPATRRIGGRPVPCRRPSCSYMAVPPA